MRLIEQHSKEEQADSLAAYLPGGRLFNAGKISGTNLRALLLGLSSELRKAEGYLKTISNEYDISTTQLFIDEWEEAVGIPDACFTGTGSLDERIKHVLVKLASLGIQTESDFEELGTMLGVTVDITPGFDLSSTFPATFPFIFFDSTKQARFTIVVDFTVSAAAKFPLTFPFTFGDADIATLECLFNKLKPANCSLLFRQV